MAPRLPGGCPRLPALGGLRVPRDRRSSDWGYAAGWRLVRAMPEFAARNAFDAGALYASRGGGPEQLRKNLARVLGVAPAEVPGAADPCFAGVLRPLLAGGVPAAVDGHAKLSRAGSTRLPHRPATTIDAALERGQGAIIALPHSGNWDMAGVWLVQHSGTFTTVAERLKPESLYRRFVDYRESLGFEMLPLHRR